MMVQQKYGILKKENFNTLLKLIRITQSSADKAIILFQEDLRSQSTFGNVDFTIQWNKRFWKANRL